MGERWIAPLYFECDACHGRFRVSVIGGFTYAVRDEHFSTTGIVYLRNGEQALDCHGIDMYRALVVRKEASGG